MPWTGSSPNQVYQRTDGTRTGSTTWQQADAASVDIVSTDHDTHDQDMGDAINSCFKKDGGNTATANLPMGGFTFTNLAAASGPLNPARLTDALISGYAATVGGTANAITLTTGYTFTAYAAGQEFSFIVGTTNTAAVTVAVDGLTAKSLVRNDGSHTALSAGDLVANALATVQYDGTRFKLISANATGTSSDVLARIVKVGSILPWPSSTVPAGWLECYGQAISRTTYAELFSVLSTTYGSGDGSTTFNLPDMRGRSIFGEDDMGGSSADRLTGLADGVNGDTLGAAGGLQSTVITQPNLPSVNLSHSLQATNTFLRNAQLAKSTFNASSGGTAVLDSGTGMNNDSETPVITGTISLGGSGTAINNVPPAIVLKWIILALPASASASTIGVNGFLYQWDTGTSDADPGSGKLRVNNATLSSATKLYINETGANSESLAAILATWDDSTSTIRGNLYIYKVGAPGTYLYAQVTGSRTDAGDYDKFDLTYVGHNGSFASGDNLAVIFIRNGDQGDTGVAGTAGDLRWLFDSTTSMADPGSGDIRLNHATLSSVTAAAVSDLCAESGNPDVSAYVLAWDDSSTTANRGTLIIKKDGAPQNFVVFTISGASTDNSGWTQLVLTYVTHNGSFSNGDTLVLDFSRTGNVGSVSGSTGSDDNRLLRADGTGGTTLQASAVTVDDSANMSGVAALSATTIELGASDTTLARSGAGVVTIEGVEVTTNTAAQTLTNKTLTAPVLGGAVDAGGASSFELPNGAAPTVDADGEIALDTSVTDFTGGLLEYYSGAVYGVVAMPIAEFSSPTNGYVPMYNSTTDTFELQDPAAAAGATAALDNLASVAINASLIPDSDNDTDLGSTTFAWRTLYAATSIELGHDSDTTLTRAEAGVVAVEGVPLFSNIPQVSLSADTTLDITHAQKHILHPAADTNNRTFTIPANASVAYPLGTCLTFINEVNTLTIAINSDTLVLAGAGTTGSRTLAAMSMATAVKKTSTSWIISGAGLT